MSSVRRDDQTAFGSTIVALYVRQLVPDLAHFGQVSQGVTGCATHLTMLFPLTWNDMLAKCGWNTSQHASRLSRLFFQMN
jgi:hypothetical protein